MDYNPHARPGQPQTRMNLRPDDAEQRNFNHTMETLMGLTPPKRITVNLKGQTMLNEFFESKRITGPWRAIPIQFVEDQFSPYVGHNV